MVYLHEHNILSAPVMDVTVSSDRPVRERCLGFVDVIDLVVSMLTGMDKKSTIVEESEEESAAADDAAPTGQVQFTGLPSRFTDVRLSDIGSLGCALQPFSPLNETDILGTLLPLLAGPVRRVAVVSDDGLSITNILSQSGIVKSLLMMDLPPVVSSTLREAGLAEQKPVLSVLAGQPVELAFKHIRDHRISGVPVLGADGGVLGNVSAREAYKVITSHNKLRLLKMPTRRFLQRTAGPQVDIRTLAICCTERDTLQDIMVRMSAAEVHRIFLCNQENKLQRVLSLGDILATFDRAAHAR
jgi:CBS domain-containing protein